MKDVVDLITVLDIVQIRGEGEIIQARALVEYARK
jgi:hypothetical protein